MRPSWYKNRMRKRSYVKIAWKQTILFFQYNRMIFHTSEFDFRRQECTKIPSKIASKMAWLKFAAKTLQDASKKLTRRPKKLSDLPQDAPPDALRCLQALPKRSKTTPRRPQDAPRRPQDGPKTLPRHHQDSPRATRVNLNSFFARPREVPHRTVRWGTCPGPRFSQFVGPFWYNCWCEFCAKKVEKHLVKF